MELFLACDLWRSYSCEGRASLVVEKDAVAQGEARLRRRARELGWSQEPGEDGAVLDACPACCYARFAAEVAGVDPPPAIPAPSGRPLSATGAGGVRQASCPAWPRTASLTALESRRGVLRERYAP